MAHSGRRNNVALASTPRRRPVRSTPTVLEPKFKLTFLGLIALTGISLLVYLTAVCTIVCLRLYGQESPPEVKELLTLFAWTWKGGFVAVATLNVGKVLNILQGS
jgi:hypothetical protein